MADIKKIYNLSDDSRGFTIYDYQPMLEAFGRIVVQEDEDDYQGDSYVLYDNDGKIGHLVFGWGSCSGCDALQACGSTSEVQELCNELEAGIKWFDCKDAALEWFEGHDWAGDFGSSSPEEKQYIERALMYLRGET